ncbi:SDR family NAD(P)-dependent oxidoreductase [Hydrocarboniphaga sp.]|uniref:SDR family NAD(P)-dependent oxidoreductase n=1 Tax=Hydrocarboniphaga sp. TaxID=2033016 RepID=UPI003D0B98D2
MKDFKNKVAAITGASSGIGRALAVDLAKRGCNLALASNSNVAGLAETHAMATDLGVTVTSKKVDVSKRTQMQAWAKQVVRDHGQVNLIVNNAGVAHAGTVLGSDYADYEWVMGINYWGVVYGTKEFLPHLIASGEGHIVNVSSVFGLFAQPAMSAYNSSKFAVRGFTESLRQELDMANNGVSATCVHPGGVKTNIASNGRFSASVADVTGSNSSQSRDSFELLLRTTPEAAAKAIVAGIRRDARRVLIGLDARAGDGMQRLLPSRYQDLVTGAMRLIKR